MEARDSSPMRRRALVASGHPPRKKRMSGYLQRRSAQDFGEAGEYGRCLVYSAPRQHRRLQRGRLPKFKTFDMPIAEE